MYSLVDDHSLLRMVVTLAGGDYSRSVDLQKSGMWTDPLKTIGHIRLMGSRVRWVEVL